jgi:hypothetical protein
MSKRLIILDMGYGADEPTQAGGMIDIKPYRAHADGTTWIFATVQSYYLTSPPTGVSLTVGEYFWFMPRHPKGETLLAQIPAGAGGFLYKDLVPVDPDTMEEIAPARPGSWVLPDPDPKLASVRDAFDDRMTARVDIGVLGASAVEGAFVSSFARTMPQRLAAKLREIYPTPGIEGGRGYIGIPSTAMSTSGQFIEGMWPITNSGMLIDPVDPAASAFDLGAKHVCATANYPSHITLTLDQPITSYDVRHSLGPTGTATTGYHAVDGGSHVPFNTYSATGHAQVDHVAAAADTTVEVGWNASGYVIPTGITEYNGDEAAGIQVHNFGHSGMTVAQWQDGYASPGSWLEAIDTFDLDCLILQDLLANDSANGISPAAGATALTNFIAILRGGGITCPIILTALYDPSGGLTPMAPWQDYVDAIDGVATADPTVAFVDHSDLGVTTVTDTYGLFSEIDHVHPRAQGVLNSWVADVYASILGPL